MSNDSYHRVAVIGLGRFGTSLARRLSTHGVEVIAIDRNRNLTEEIRDDVAIAVRLDATDEAALRSQEIDRVDCVVVAIGEQFEAALLTTVICRKNLNVPHIICRAQTQLHAEIFTQIGADEVIQPEQNAGDALGRRLAHPRINDYIRLGEGFTVVEMLAPSKFSGRTVREIDLRSTYGVNLIAIRREVTTEAASDSADEATALTRVISVPGPDDRLESSDLLLLAGTEESLASLPQE